MAQNTTPEWANGILGAQVEVDKKARTVTITISADNIVAEGRTEDKKGNPKDPTLYVLRTVGEGDINRPRPVEIPELAVNGVTPVFDFNGWFPKATSPKPSSARILATVVSASERLAAARKG